jgi:hypothetical protein
MMSRQARPSGLSWDSTPHVIAGGHGRSISTRLSLDHRQPDSRTFAAALTDRKWNRATVLPLRWRTRVEIVRLLVVGALALVSLFAFAPAGLLVMKAR